MRQSIGCPSRGTFAGGNCGLASNGHEVGDCGRASSRASITWSSADFGLMSAPLIDHLLALVRRRARSEARQRSAETKRPPMHFGFLLLTVESVCCERVVLVKLCFLCFLQKLVHYMYMYMCDVFFGVCM